MFQIATQAAVGLMDSGFFTKPKIHFREGSYPATDAHVGHPCPRFYGFHLSPSVSARAHQLAVVAGKLDPGRDPGLSSIVDRKGCLITPSHGLYNGGGARHHIPVAKTPGI